MTYTTQDIRNLGTAEVKIFCSTLNTAGKVLVSIVGNPTARNKNDGRLIYQHEFSRFNKVSKKQLELAKSAITAAGEDL